MSISYDWVIRDILNYPNEGDSTQFQINWKCEASNDGKKVAYIGTVYQNNLYPYVPYSNLTEDIIWGLINAQIERTEIEKVLALQLNVGETVVPKLPW